MDLPKLASVSFQNFPLLHMIREHMIYIQAKESSNFDATYCCAASAALEDIIDFNA